MQQWKAEPYVKTSCSLGEGVCYVPERNEVRFLDINNSRLYHVNIDRGPSSLREVDTKQPVGVTVDIQGVDSAKTILVGAKDGVTKFDLTTGEHEYVAKYWSGTQAQEKSRRMRSNDGAVDSSGRFWVEAFVDPEIEDPTEEGTVFRLDDGKSLTTMYEKIVIPNGITWNAADDRMHLTDTTVGKIYAFDYKPSSGNITNKRVLYQHVGEGNPGR